MPQAHLSKGKPLPLQPHHHLCPPPTQMVSRQSNGQSAGGRDGQPWWYLVPRERSRTAWLAAPTVKEGRARQGGDTGSLWGANWLPQCIRVCCAAFEPGEVGRRERVFSKRVGNGKGEALSQLSRELAWNSNQLGNTLGYQEPTPPQPKARERGVTPAGPVLSPRAGAGSLENEGPQRPARTAFGTPPAGNRAPELVTSSCPQPPRGKPGPANAQPGPEATAHPRRLLPPRPPRRRARRGALWVL